jgi:hypothetical protein
MIQLKQQQHTLANVVLTEYPKRKPQNVGVEKRQFIAVFPVIGRFMLIITYPLFCHVSLNSTVGVGNKLRDPKRVYQPPYAEARTRNQVDYSECLATQVKLMKSE